VLSLDIYKIVSYHYLSSIKENIDTIGMLFYGHRLDNKSFRAIVMIIVLAGVHVLFGQGVYSQQPDVRQQIDCETYVGSCVAKSVTVEQRTPFNIKRVGADLSPTLSGNGKENVNVDIAILDTGVQTNHPDLNVWLLGCVSVILNDDGKCADKNGHGTQVAGVAAAIDNDIGVVGTAPGARIWAIKISDQSEAYSWKDMTRGLEYVLDHSNEIEVVNLSFGGKGTATGAKAAEQAVKELVNKGVVVVLPAGNENADVMGRSPARVIDALTVSAITDTDGKCGGLGVDGPPIPFGIRAIMGKDDSIAPDSNYGEIIDIAASGDVLTTSLESGYVNVHGTSFAAPAVAGAAALYKSLNPQATPTVVWVFLHNTGTRAPASSNPLIPCNGKGIGYFDPGDNPHKEPLLYMGTNYWCQKALCPSQVPLKPHILK
jgi:subtilisin